MADANEGMAWNEPEGLPDDDPAWVQSRREWLREEQRDREDVRARIRAAQKAGDEEAAGQMANAEKMRRAQNQDWDETLGFPDMKVENQAADAAAGQGAQDPANRQKQVDLDQMARSISPADPWNARSSDSGWNDEAVGLLKEIASSLKELATKLDNDARWGV